MNSQNDLIAITGCGSVSPLGFDRSAIYSKYLTDETFIVNRSFNNKVYPVAALPDEAEQQLISLTLKNSKCKKVDKTVLMAMQAASMAFEEAGWNATPGTITGINIGSSRGSAALFEQLHEEFLKSRGKKTSVFTSPLTTLGYISNHVASHLNVSGPAINTSVTCSTGIQAICNSIAWLKSGMANRFIAGGSEAPLTSFTLAQVEALGIYSNLDNSKYPCAPLSIAEKDKNTFVLGEGAAVFAIEKMNIVELKERRPLGIIESVGFSFERPSTLTGIGEDGSLIAASMKMALENMLTDSNVDLILLHCPGTVKGDEAELNAIKKVFKGEWPNIFSNKWKIGHTYSASSALNLELGLLCLQNNFFPVFPYKTLVNNSERNIRKIMINATGFGGNATSIIVSHPDIIG
ncbi:MAG: beta-ketoacyl synthase N-terminal-like domain-containing protein [Bacteroidales bacterium]